jgi:hypothetical protein
MGKVTIGNTYFVDLDNEAQVDEAKECLMEDMMNAVKYDELPLNIKITPEPNATEADIPEFLTEMED